MNRNKIFFFSINSMSNGWKYLWSGLASHWGNGPQTYVRDYLWCTSQLGFQKIFDQILQNTPVLEFGSRTPPPNWNCKSKLFPESPPENWNCSKSTSLTLPRTNTPPPKWKTLTFFPEFRSELTQNTPPMKNSNFLSWVQIWAYPEHPPMKNSNFLSWVQIWAYPEPPPPHPTLTGSGWSMWRLYPPRIPSSFDVETCRRVLLCMVSLLHTVFSTTRYLLLQHRIPAWLCAQNCDHCRHHHTRNRQNCYGNFHFTKNWNTFNT